MPAKAHFQPYLEATCCHHEPCDANGGGLCPPQPPRLGFKANTMPEKPFVWVTTTSTITINRICICYYYYSYILTMTSTITRTIIIIMSTHSLSVMSPCFYSIISRFFQFFIITCNFPDVSSCFISLYHFYHFHHFCIIVSIDLVIFLIFHHFCIISLYFIISDSSLPCFYHLF